MATLTINKVQDEPSDSEVLDGSEIMFAIESADTSERSDDEDEHSSFYSVHDPASNGGHTVVEQVIDKKKLFELEMIDDFPTGTIPSTARFSISIITNVSDQRSLRLMIKTCLSLNLMDEVLFLHKNKIKMYAVSVHSILQDDQTKASTVERDFVFNITEKNGQVTCFFDLGYQDDLLEFQSDKIKVRYCVKVSPVASFNE